MRLQRLAFCLVGLLFISGVHAQAYPAKPVRLVVPLPPGALTDIVMRANAQELSQRLGQPLVVDNRPGGNWVIGVESCLKGGTDGYTLCVVNSDAMSYNPYILNQLTY